MGCLNSKDQRASKYEIAGHHDDDGADTKQDGPPVVKGQQTSAHAVTASSGKVNELPKPRLDPKDFKFVDCKNEVKIKLPGTINGQSFMIDQCENCDIYILDYCSQVTIDDCKGCRIFIGPTDGSVFIRDCSKCSLVTVCRQLRTRDCTDCRIGLHCRTKPVVEESTRLGFACFDLAYPGLQEHMRQANLGPFHNFWSDVFDFTPKDSNWQLMPPASTSRSLLEPLPAEAAAALGLAPAAAAEEPVEAAEPSPVFKSLGSQQPAGPAFLFAAFDAGRHEQAAQLARHAAEQGWLLRTNETKLSAVAAAALAKEAGWGKGAGKALSCPGKVGCVGLELGLPEGELEAAKARVKELGGHSCEGEAAAKSFRFMGLEG